VNRNPQSLETVPETVKTPLILVVDDAAINLKMLARGLGNEGYRVMVADNGPEGRALASDHQPDLIVLDILMPGESGFEAIRLLKADARTASIPVIFLTGEDALESKLEGFELGAVDYITKPFHLAEVKARVRLHIRLNLATRALIANQAARLHLVADAQSSILLEPERLPDARFGRYFAPVWEAGGDFYHVLAISEEIHGYFVADVSGHDISTGFVTSAVKALLLQNCKPMYQPVESMNLINSVLQETLPADKYMTAAYLFLNRKRNQATVVSMGHLPLLCQQQEGGTRLLFQEGDILGAFPRVTFASKTFAVRPGDRFFLYSDGLVERVGAERLWTETVTLLPEAVDALRAEPIDRVATILAEQMAARFGKADDDVVVLATEV